MNIIRDKCIWLQIAMLILLGVYLFLNTDKLITLPAKYHWMINGSPAGKLILRIPRGKIKEISLPSSDIFDADGERQLAFSSFAPDALDAIRAGPDSLALKLDGMPIATRPKEANGYLYLDLPHHKLFLVPDGKLKAIATILLQERAARKDIVHCAAGGDCSGVLIQFAGPAWGSLEGPLPGVYVSATNDPLPRGRWVTDHAAGLRIEAARSTRLVLRMSMLGVTADQEVKLQGAVLAVSSSMSGEKPRDYLHMQLRPMTLTATVDLHEGVNDFVLVFSSAVHPASDPGNIKAAFMTDIEMYTTNGTQNGHSEQ
ncbi:MAG: hypothetical protein V3S33_07775 [Gammaproteobacteria bacterium]